MKECSRAKIEKDEHHFQLLSQVPNTEVKHKCISSCQGTPVLKFQENLSLEVYLLLTSAWLEITYGIDHASEINCNKEVPIVFCQTAGYILNLKKRLHYSEYLLIAVKYYVILIYM